jgi:hypothetical protein
MTEGIGVEGIEPAFQSMERSAAKYSATAYLQVGGIWGVYFAEKRPSSDNGGSAWLHQPFASWRKLRFSTFLFALHICDELRE